MSDLQEVPKPAAPAVLREGLLDRAIARLSPGWAVQRRQARLMLAASDGLLGGGLRGGYEGASRSRRQTSNWQAAELSADQALIPDLNTLRDRSYDLLRNAPLARGALNTVCTNVVGEGLMPQARIDADYLGLDEAQAAAWQAEWERLYWLATDTPEIDLARQNRFGALQRQVLYNAFAAGDCFVQLVYLARPGSPFALKLNLIDAARCRNPSGFAEQARLRANAVPNVQHPAGILTGGILSDAATGAPLGGFFADRHPGDLSATVLTYTYLPFFGPQSGRRQVLHLKLPDRIAQTRGEPWLAPVVETLRMISRYTEAEIFAAVVNACFTVVSKTDPNGLGPRSPLFAAAQAGAASEPAKNSNLKRMQVDFQPGMVLEGFAPNEAIEAIDPNRPNAAFDPFVQAMLRQVGVALELPFEVLIKHFTASYSAARAALLEAWKFYRRIRAWLRDEFCQPVYEALLIEASARQIIAAPGLFSDPLALRAWAQSEWIGPAAGQIDPNKEADANVTMVERGWKTNAQVTAEMTGGDFDQNIRQCAKEAAQQRALGLVPASDRQVSRQDNGAPASAPALAPGQDQDRPEQEDQS